MSENREVYHDPDYSQFQSTHTDGKLTDNSPETKSSSDKSPEGRIATIRRIIEREFQTELTKKEKESEEINKRLEESKKLLAKVRYAVVNHYYNQKHLLCTEDEVAAVYKMQQDEMVSYPAPGNKPQMAIHPSLKKLLGSKRPIDYNEILKIRPTRKAAQNATEQFHKMKKKPAETRIKMAEPMIKDEAEPQAKKPRYIEPSSSIKHIQQVNSARGRNIYRHLLVVGNISKYIGNEEADLATSVTHKWLVYVSTKTSVPIDLVVSRARFFLHDSYKPNDVVEISSPPFQITKRGWGEFPVRVQLYFHDHLAQKPLQIFHTIILDKKHTGLQTMGAETLVELYLNIPNSIDEAKPSTSDATNEPRQHVAGGSKIVKSEPSTSKTSLLTCTSSNLPPPPIQQKMPSPIQSTSARAISRIEAPMKAHPLPIETVIKQEVVIKQEPMDYGESRQEEWQNGHQNIQSSQIAAAVKVKTEPRPVTTPIFTAPQLKICDQNNVNLGVASTSTQRLNKPMEPVLRTPVPIVKGIGKKTFVKCIGKDGKVSLMELVQDEKNPKLFKMVLPPGVQATNKLVIQHGQGNIRAATPIVIQPNLIRPTVNVMLQPGSVRTGQIGSLNSLQSPTPALEFGAKIASAIKVPALAVNVQNATNMRISLSNLVSPSKNPPNQLLNVSYQSAMPKLVAINSPHPSTSGVNRSIPHSVAVTAAVSTLQTNDEQRSPLTQKPNLSPLTIKGVSSPLTKVLQQNKKVIILDASRMPKQQSLLKPQVSLLKPRLQPTNVNNLQKITVSNISGLANRNINVFVPAGVKIEANNIQPTGQTALSSPLQSQARRRYGDEVEKRFTARTFAHMSEAIGWLLKEIPLISPLAAQPEFREIFPFVVPNPDDFQRLLVVKQRNFEWLRAKYINRLVSKHDSLKTVSKWTTRNIVLFGRWFGYTPKSVFNTQKSCAKTETELNVHEIVKSELMKEHLHNDTISFNAKLTKWLDDVEENVSKGIIKAINDERIIVVDDDEDELNQSKRKASPLKPSKSHVQLPIQRPDEIMWINEICRKMQIRFEQEEIADGVFHRSAELVFATALRSFVEDLLRKCSGNKLCTPNSSSSNMEIGNDDILHTISTIQQFDFLTNKNLGTGKPSP